MLAKLPYAFNSIRAKGLVNVSAKYFGVRKSIYNRKLKVSKSLIDEGITNENTIDVTHSTQEDNERKSTKESLHMKEILQDDQNDFDKQSEMNMDYDFTEFKKRNKEINKKIHKEQSDHLDEDNSKKNKTKTEIDPKTLEKLQSLINEDQDNWTKGFAEDFKKINDVTPIPIEDEATKESDVLVHRPSKNFVWGLGEQVKRKKPKFIFGQYPTVESIVGYLEEKNIQNILIVPTHSLGLHHLKENAIVCTGFTAKHIYTTAKDLVVELKKLKIPNLPYVPTVFGRRDEEWLLVEIGDIVIHLFTESLKEEFDLVDHWLNPMSEDFKDFIKRVDAKTRGVKHL